MWNNFKKKGGGDECKQGLDTRKKGSNQLSHLTEDVVQQRCKQEDGGANSENCKSECWGFHQ